MSSHLRKARKGPLADRQDGKEQVDSVKYESNGATALVNGHCLESSIN